VIQSFSFTDLASGTGIVEYFGAKDEDTLLLTATPFFSNRVITTVDHSSPGGVDNTTFDLDFDVKFNLPRTINGEVIVNVPFIIRNLFGTTQNYEVYFKIYVRKWDGSTETEIANDTGEQLSISLTASPAEQAAKLTTSVTVSNALFGVNDSLRITVEGHFWNGGTTSRYSIGHSPNNQPTDIFQVAAGSGITFGSERSVLSVLVPFKIFT